jgi:hypothetical protein
VHKFFPGFRPFQVSKLSLDKMGKLFLFQGDGPEFFRCSVG